MKLLKPATLLTVGGVLVSVYAMKLMVSSSTPERLNCDDIALAEQPEVVLYGTSWCSLCKKSRWLLEDNNIAYCEYDIEKSSTGAARYQQLDGRAPPLIMIGSQRVDGFNKININSALRKEGLIN